VTGTGHAAEGALIPRLEALLRELGRWRKGDDLRLVHRLDRDTCGVILEARNPETARFLERRFLQREVRQRYRALVQGRPGQDRFRRDAPVDPQRPPGEERGPARPARVPSARGTARTGAVPVTEFLVLERFPEGALLEARPLTGRTHQIRIHLAGLGLPVLGDPLYGPSRCGSGLARAVSRQMLHAESLTFRDPDTGQDREIGAPVPADMEEVAGWLRTGRR